VSEVDKRFGKPKCSMMVMPLPTKANRNPEKRRCGCPEFKDGFCKRHHPAEIAKLAQEKEIRNREHQAERMRRIVEMENGVTDIDRAIALLVKNGFKVEVK
jgi:hypothetical protein